MAWKLCKELKNLTLTYQILYTLLFELDTQTILLIFRQFRVMCYTKSFNYEFKDIVLYRKNTVTIIKHFWARWRRENLSELMEHPKIVSRGSGIEVKVGDVVIVEEEPLPRHMWMLGVVLELFEGCNGFSRGAEF